VRAPCLGALPERGFGGVPPMGTAGLERCLVSGYRREPAPPPRMMDSTVLDSGASFAACRKHTHTVEFAISSQRELAPQPTPPVQSIPVLGSAGDPHN
jgi:hypothetical protein